ncbi:hypothetical protein EVAR_96157_1 [Eumeta japonica]|uniref:Uncharacterized protein n=1 Tax=Eumeta variegata TaxID=151549 RepID=A0A4C1VLC3_EUMVA|nr:hypothetical protein EVAR_96157_1 [Eumeta japonica]
MDTHDVGGDTSTLSISWVYTLGIYIRNRISDGGRGGLIERGGLDGGKLWSDGREQGHQYCLSQDRIQQRKLLFLLITEQVVLSISKALSRRCGNGYYQLPSRSRSVLKVHRQSLSNRNKKIAGARPSDGPVRAAAAR